MKNKLLTDKELVNLCMEIPEWNLINSKLERTFNFPNFIEAFGFICKVAIIAETIGHHPNWSNSYSFVKIELTTHELDGLSYSDINLAKRINEVIHTKNNQLLN